MANKRQKHMDVDVIAFLEERMKSNTKHYQSDFEIDKNMIERFAQSQRKEDKTLLWMSRPNGTHCLRECEAFICDTPAYITWRFYAEETKDPIVACAVELTGSKNGVIHGNVYELDYRAFASELAAKAVEPLEVEKTYEDGFVDRVAFERSSYGYYVELIEEHGPIVDSLAIPRDKDQLKQVLSEQRAVRNKMKAAQPSLSSQIQSASSRVAEPDSIADARAKETAPER